MSTTTDTTTTTHDQLDHQQDQDEAAQNTLKTLADILAARTRKLERERAEAAEQAQRDLEGRRQDEITHFTVRYEKMFPPSLRDALNATIDYDTARETDDEPRSAPFAAFDHNGDRWTVRRGYHYGDPYWQLDGPHGYAVQLAQDWDYNNPTGPLLDALNAYPQWLDTRDEREREKAEKAAEKEAAAQRRRDEHPLYAYVSGDLADHPHLGMLHTGSKLWITVETPTTGEYGEKTETHKAEVIDWDSTWLLINLDDDEFDQRLIPIARVVHIRTRA